jgi:hypothetical protein
VFALHADVGRFGDVCELWVKMQGDSIAVTWIGFCLSLAFVNTFLWNKSGA